ncbi:MAG: tagaturonate reductase [Planctomycetes bacterium]|nr:tagaturonate reductase [Planctomycetota bacterium]
MARLDRSRLDAIRTGGTVDVGPSPTGPERILQIGEGNFLRAFVDWMVDRANAAGVFDGRIVVVQPRNRRQGTVSVLQSQEGLYTVFIRGCQDGALIDRAEIVQAVSRGINPYEHWDAFLACAANPHLRFLVSNTTEAGVVYEPTGRPDGACPASFPAKVTALLLERWRRFDGAPDKGLILLPCELIDRNGDTLRDICLRHAADWGLDGAFIGWMTGANHFLNTLVDRIVPGFPADQADALAARCGYEDALMVACEPYHLWAIEGPAALEAELPLARAGLNVVWTDNLTPYRYRKVRILNGAHMALVPTAFLAGADTVGQSVEHPVIGGYLRATLRQEILPTLAMDDGERQAYAAATLDRFANPFIRHALLSIALNSVAKFPVRLLPTLLEYVRQRGSIPRRMALALAALLAMYRTTEIADGLGRGVRGGQPYPINDSGEVLAFFVGVWKRYDADGDAGALCRAALARKAFWGRDLNEVPGLHAAVAEALSGILAGDILKQMEALG